MVMAMDMGMGMGVGVGVDVDVVEGRRTGRCVGAQSACFTHSRVGSAAIVSWWVQRMSSLSVVTTSVAVVFCDRCSRCQQ
jgi:hypothetical protein